MTAITQLWNNWIVTVTVPELIRGQFYGTMWAKIRSQWAMWYWVLGMEYQHMILVGIRYWECQLLTMAHT